MEDLGATKDRFPNGLTLGALKHWMPEVVHLVPNVG